MKSDYIKNTKKAEQKKARAAAAYAYSGRAWNIYKDIYDAYARPSVAKVRAWHYCKQLCAELGGHDLIICGKNCMVFSVCFKFEDEAGREAVSYITRDYDRFAYVEAEQAEIKIDEEAIPCAA